MEGALQDGAALGSPEDTGAILGLRRSIGVYRCQGEGS
jgi:hypothetical protein